MSSFFWQDGYQVTASSLQSVYAGVFDNQTLTPVPVGQFGAVWQASCNVTYSPDDCNLPLRATSGQWNSLISNFAKLGHCLVDFEAKTKSQNITIGACGINQYTWVADSFCYFLTQVVTIDKINDTIADIGCAVANSPTLATTPLYDDVILIIRKGATSADPCIILTTNVNSLALSQWQLMPLVGVSSIGGIHQYNIWQNSNINANEPLLDLSGNIKGYVSLTSNSWATLAVTDLSGTPTQYYVAP
jgi:hypothetical protein